MALSFFTLPKEPPKAKEPETPAKEIEAVKEETPAEPIAETAVEVRVEEPEKSKKQALSAEGKKFIQNAEKATRPRGRPRKYREKRIQSCIYFTESNLNALHKIQEENPDFTISTFINKLVEKALKENPKGY